MAEIPLEGWAVWHPKHGLSSPHFYEGAIAWLDLDGAIKVVKELNADDGTNNRNGWRAVRCSISRAEEAA